jgi:hypothetical protein
LSSSYPCLVPSELSKFGLTEQSTCEPLEILETFEEIMSENNPITLLPEQRRILEETITTLMAKCKALEEREYPNIPIVPPSHAPAPKEALPEKFDGSAS